MIFQAETEDFGRIAYVLCTRREMGKIGAQSCGRREIHRTWKAGGRAPSRGKAAAQLAPLWRQSFPLCAKGLASPRLPALGESWANITSSWSVDGQPCAVQGRKIL